MIDFIIEVRKAKYRKLWGIILGIIVIQCLWISWGMKNANAKELSVGFHSLLYQIPLMNTILLPLSLGVLSSRIWDTEHKGKTFKMLYTMQKREKIYRCKTLYGLLYIIIIAILQVVLMLFIGKVFGVTQQLPMEHIMYMFINTCIVSIVIYLIQQIFTFIFENQLVALCIGLIGSFLGLFSAFFPMQLQKFIVWSYYNVLYTIGMNWEKETRVITYFQRSYNIKSCVVIVCLGIFVYFLGKKLFTRKEV